MKRKPQYILKPSPVIMVSYMIHGNLFQISASCKTQFFLF